MPSARRSALRKLSPGQPLPDRPSFKIGEVATLLGVATSLLRFWETEFKVVKPRKTKSKQRSYTPGDVTRLREIQHLLKVEGYTIAGARRRLSGAPTVSPDPAELARLRERLAAALAEVAALEKLVDAGADAEGA